MLLRNLEPTVKVPWTWGASSNFPAFGFHISVKILNCQNTYYSLNKILHERMRSMLPLSHGCHAWQECCCLEWVADEKSEGSWEYLSGCGIWDLCVAVWNFPHLAQNHSLDQSSVHNVISSVGLGAASHWLGIWTSVLFICMETLKEF